MKALSVNNLTFHYEEGKEALDNVSFSVEEGQYVSILGHNGSGKSTLAKILVGLLGGYSGRVDIFGTELNSKSIKSLRKDLGIVFQNPDNQFVGSSVSDDIAFGLENTGVKHEDMDAIINEFAKEVDVLPFLGKEPENLSGGQKQRVALAGVLSMNPKLLLLDEATSMLDPLGKKDISDLLLKMRKKNPSLTILSITHDVEEAALSDEVIVLSEGKLVLQGTPKEVFSQGEVLESIRLFAPFYYRLRDALTKRGFSIPNEVNDLSSLEAYLCQK